MSFTQTFRTITLLSCILLLLVHASPAHAAHSPKKVAVITAVGEVEMLEKGAEQWTAVSEGDILSEGDTVKTRAGARAQLQFPTGSVITLNEKTTFLIENVADPTKTNLIDGRIKAVIEGLEKESSFEVRTPTSISGVRGTIFYLNVYKKSEDVLSERSFFDNFFGIGICYAAAGDNVITELFVEQGNVLFTNLLSNISYMVGQNQGSSADYYGDITEPKDVPPDKQKEWKDPFEPPKKDEGGKKDEDGKKKEEEGKKSSPTQKAEKSTVEKQDPPPPPPPFEPIEPPKDPDNQETKDSKNINNLPPPPPPTGSSRVDLSMTLDELALRQELVELHNDVADMEHQIELAELDARLEEIQDAQAGKVMRDMHGRIVRHDSYVLRPTDRKVALMYLSHRRDGVHAGVSSLVLQVAFNRSLEGADLKTDIPWGAIMNDEHDGIYYNSMPRYYPRPAAEGETFDPSADEWSMMLSVKNPFGDFAKLYEGFGELSEFGAPAFAEGSGESLGSGGGTWMQEALDPLYDMNINGIFKQINNEAAWTLNPNGSASYYAEFGDKTFFRADAYVVGDDGTVYDKDHYIDGSSELLSIYSMRSFFKPDRKYNLELTAGASEFDGRTIDVIVSPEVMRPYYQPERE